MKIEHLPLLKSVSEPAVHPDGLRAVVAVTRPDFDADSYVGQLWEVPLTGERPGAKPVRRITRGFRDSAPQFSPDGAVLAFLRAAPGKPAQLCIVDADGGEPQIITDRKLGVGTFDWSPDSRQIAFTSRVPQEGRYGTLDGVPAGAEDARHITTLKFRMNGTGYTEDKRAHIFLLNVPAVDAEPAVIPVGRAKNKSGNTSAEPAEQTGATEPAGDEHSPAVPTARQLTAVNADHSAPRFTMDGNRILFTAGLHPGADKDLVSDVYSISTDGSGLTKLSNLTGPTLSAGAPTESADGQWLFYLAGELGTNRQDFVAAHYAIYVAPTDDPAAVRRLTDDRTMDFTETGERLERIGADGVLALDRARGAINLVRVSASGNVGVLVDGPRLVTGVGAGRDVVVVAFTDAASAGDVAVLDDGALRTLTDFSAEFRSAAGVISAREITHTAPDGYPVHGWVLLPEGEGPHPVLLNIHGGPFAQYGWGLFDEAQVYADAGYAVLMCNPRGAAGYGYNHARSIKEAMGTVDLNDVLAFLDGALASETSLDSQSLGIMGGSYGGYLTAWTISQDHRFTAAIVERGYLDPPSFVGSSDIGWFFSNEYTGTDPDAVRAQNPMAQVDKVSTPTLLIHSEEDLRCPLEQAHRYYTALKMRGMETELVVFPGENHELSRSGTPHHRKQRFEHILRWWARHLPTTRNPAPAPAEA